jgi:hypothetical protein
MSEMNRKKLYVMQLGTFLHSNGMTMSAAELADHLNRNGFRTAQGTQFEGGRGTYTLIEATWRWVNNDLGLECEAGNVAMAFVKNDGTHAWDKPDTEETEVSNGLEEEPEQIGRIA